MKGEIVRAPYSVLVGPVQVDGFDDDHSLNDIARWVVGKSEVDARELARILLDMVGGE